MLIIANILLFVIAIASVVSSLAWVWLCYQLRGVDLRMFELEMRNLWIKREEAKQKRPMGV